MKWIGRIAGALSAGIVAVALTACAEVSSPAARAPTTRVVRSGEEIFRGLVFGEGEVASALPEIWTGGRQALANATGANGDAAGIRFEEIKARVIAEIRTAHPDFFTRFGQDVQSGDHVRIAEVMEEASRNFKEAAERAYPELVTGPGTGTGACVTVVVVGNVAFIVNVFVYANVVYVTNWVFDEDSPENGELIRGDTKLGSDQIIQLIAERLAT